MLYNKIHPVVWPGPQFAKLWSQIPLVDITPRSESSFFYFIFDPAIVGDYFKTKLKDEELDEGGRCSHLKKFPEKFHIAECCITDLPEGMRHSDFPKRELLQNSYFQHKYEFLRI